MNTHAKQSALCHLKRLDQFSRLIFVSVSLFLMKHRWMAIVQGFFSGRNDTKFQVDMIREITIQQYLGAVTLPLFASIFTISVRTASATFSIELSAFLVCIAFRWSTKQSRVFMFIACSPSPLIVPGYWNSNESFPGPGLMYEQKIYARKCEECMQGDNGQLHPKQKVTLRPQWMRLLRRCWLQLQFIVHFYPRSWRWRLMKCIYIFLNEDSVYSIRWIMLRFVFFNFKNDRTI